MAHEKRLNILYPVMAIVFMLMVIIASAAFEQLAGHGERLAILGVGMAIGTSTSLVFNWVGLNSLKTTLDDIRYISNLTMENVVTLKSALAMTVPKFGLHFAQILAEQTVRYQNDSADKDPVAYTISTMKRTERLLYELNAATEELMKSSVSSDGFCKLCRGHSDVHKDECAYLQADRVLNEILSHKFTLDRTKRIASSFKQKAIKNG